MSTTTDTPRSDGSAPAGTALEVRDLRVARTADGAEVLHGVSFAVAPGTILALVGESGSGKTTAGLAGLGHFRRGLRHTGGTVLVSEDGHAVDILELTEPERRRLRGGSISYVPQDPALSLNPAMRIGAQILEVLHVHGYGGSEQERRDRVAQVMQDVGMPHDEAALRKFPHQLSGGQQQRIGIAMAFACRPAVMVLDEPTTGLDVSTQALVLETVSELAARHDVAGVYITHDLAVVAQVAQQVAVMKSGELVEQGDCAQVLYRPRHPYTRKLLSAVPDLEGRRSIGDVDAITGDLPAVDAPLDAGGETGTADAPPQPDGAAEAPRPVSPSADAAAGGDLRGESRTVPGEVPATGQAHAGTVSTGNGAIPAGAGSADGPAGPGVTEGPDGTAGGGNASAPEAVLDARDLRLAYGAHQVLDGISLSLRPGESMMLLGESGSGKTTLARCLSGLIGSYEGEVRLDGRVLAPATRQRSVEERRRIQYVFQSPFSSLNPRRTVAESIEVPLRMNYSSTPAQRRQWVLDALDQVKLGREFADRRPGELSGGERQRVAIARALVNAPSVLICDEVTSALDVSVQASIVDLLRTLQIETGMAMLFVTHNIALARHISQRLAVLQRGKIVDMDDTAVVLEQPKHGYTRELIANVPSL
ncbi:ATP-binding cassette domain-containing protein [Sediminivirga luteola]|uniref:ABC transporter ATP-binding protein n=1 Tax=Sediminivirga luteola TaxID=1774748 RepID=A0A8J2TW33_9MICO|nr:ABC transporter ATP-binding protein [Sediminivirga luteola]MCI2264431.1 ATP-binding cassette domain-containing protein [Sediminivirga luteola]GGA06128.1 ABC transporter ATP-binding protein [Sediminivirga luteola]